MICVHVHLRFTTTSQHLRLCGSWHRWRLAAYTHWPYTVREETIGTGPSRFRLVQSRSRGASSVQLNPTPSGYWQKNIIWAFLWLCCIFFPLAWYAIWREIYLGSMRAWDRGWKHVSHAKCVRVGNPGISMVSTFACKSITDRTVGQKPVGRFVFFYFLRGKIEKNTNCPILTEIKSWRSNCKCWNYSTAKSKSNHI